MQLRVTLIVFFLLSLIVIDSRAQFWKKKKKADTDISAAQENSLNAGTYGRAPERDAFAPKVSRKASRNASRKPSTRSARGPTYGAIEAYYDRMEAVAKERRKAARIMEKPQYSNPLYFGHKRPPKKRKPSKMKYCKVCGIRH